jgi:lipopolysaccharide/colanic/teichoic acid biosynthesis glycosyltransferase
MAANDLNAQRNEHVLKTQRRQGSLNAADNQVQVNMTPKTKASMRKVVAYSAAASQDSHVQPATTNLRSAPARVDYPVREPTNEPSFILRPSKAVPRPLYEASKRVFDLLLGVPLLIIATPIIMVAAAAIRLESPGSPIFIQKRLGKGGRPFKIVKLRGMYRDAKILFPSYYDYSTKKNLDFCFHEEVDPRVTQTGKFIRKTSIDELPNLWNVVRGDMSLVGPRPEIPEVLALYGPYREEYLSVKPGVTCLSKCTGRDRLTKRETIEFDLKYIRNRRFRDDLKILWRTFRQVLLIRDVF